MQKLITDSQFGQNLREIRLSHGYTQEETVGRLQLLGSPLSRATYSIIEMGKGNLYVSDLVGLQQIFGVRYEEFFKNIPTER